MPMKRTEGGRVLNAVSMGASPATFSHFKMASTLVRVLSLAAALASRALPALYAKQSQQSV